MKKTYMTPTIMEIKLTCTQQMLAGSGGGVSEGSTLGDEFSNEDVSYSRRSFSVWDEE